jgi:hypothetical protein
MGTRCAWGLADEACSSSSRLTGPTRAEREDGVREKEQRTLDGGEVDRGGICVHDGTRQSGEGLQ